MICSKQHHIESTNLLEFTVNSALNNTVTSRKKTTHAQVASHSAHTYINSQ